MKDKQTWPLFSDHPLPAYAGQLRMPPRDDEPAEAPVLPPERFGPVVTSPLVEEIRESVARALAERAAQ